MSLFEIIISIAVCVYVLTSIYFSITGRIINKKQTDFDDQMKVFTTRIGEVMTENHNLNSILREWQEAYIKLQKEYEELKKKLEEPKKTTRKKKETKE